MNLRNHSKAGTTMPEELDLSRIQDFLPAGDGGSSPDQAIYRLQNVIAYRSADGEHPAHHYILVRHPDNTWTRVDDLHVPAVQAGLPTLRLAEGYKPHVLAYVRARTDQADRHHDLDKAQRRHISSPAVNPAVPPSQAHSAETNLPTTTAPQDVSTWDAERFQAEFRTLGVCIGNLTDPAKLLAKWQAYHRAAPKAQLGFLRKSALVRRASDAGLGDLSACTKKRIIAVIGDHSRPSTQPQKLTSNLQPDQTHVQNVAPLSDPGRGRESLMLTEAKQRAERLEKKVEQLASYLNFLGRQYQLYVGRP